MSMNQQVAQQAASDLKSLWGGRFPTWEEFKEASQDGRVRVNKTLAAEAIYLDTAPSSYKILYGYVTLWLGFLALPISIALWFFLDISGWWILGGFVAAWFLVRVSRDGHCEGIKVGAEQDPEFYDLVVKNGGLLFEPKT